MPPGDLTSPDIPPPSPEAGQSQFAVERARLVAALTECLDEAELLSGVLACCARCRLEGTDDHARQVRAYVTGHARFTTGTCATCAAACMIRLPEGRDD